MDPEARTPSWIVDAQQHLVQAYDYEKTGQHTEALAECDHAIGIDPDLAEAHNLRGIVLEALDRPVEAVQAYQTAFELDPALTEAQENLSQLADDFLEEAYELYEENRDPMLALGECDAVLEINPSYAEAHNLRGVILERLGQHRDALAAYRRAASLDPDLEEAADNLAGLEADLADVSARDELVAVARVSHPATAEVLRGKLEAAGIPAAVTDAEIVYTLWLWSQAMGGVKVVVRREDRDVALEVLGLKQEWDELAQEYEEEWEDEDTDEPSDESTDTSETPGDGNGLTEEATIEPEPGFDRDQAEQALAELTAEAMAEPPEDDPLAMEAASAPAPAPCPNCGSLNVRYLPYAQRPAFVAWLLIGVPVPFPTRKWKCAQCGHEWRMQE
jgi:Flp pilus assembly protein TadD